MLPIRLTIEGLYSYQERQVIDFTQLTAAGLFGIFGETGSGKSSVLEAITYALYGETERMNNRDDRGYNMMNLRSNLLYIEFDFKSPDNHLYRITKTHKRNSKQFEKVGSPETVFYEFKDEKWQPADKKVEEVLGISYSNFIKTIIIPQGKFRDFVELGGADRTKMLKEIFCLQQFDLFAKVSHLQTENELKISNIEGKLTALDVSKEMLTEKQQEVNKLSKEFELMLQEFALKEVAFKKLEEQKKDFLLLKERKSVLLEKEKQKTKIDSNELIIKKFESLSKSFSLLLNNLKKAENDLKLKSKTFGEKQSELNKIREELVLWDKKLKNNLAYFEQLPQKREEETDLKLMKDLRASDDEIKKSNIRIIEGEKLIQNLNQELNDLEKRVQVLVNEISEWNKKKPETRTMMDISNWFKDNQSLKNNLIQQTKNLNEWIESQNTQKSKYKEYEQDVDKFIEELNRQELQLQAEKKKAEERKNHLEVQKKLSAYTENLKEGMPCPLCGSIEHPEVAHVHIESEEYQELIDRMEMLNRKLSDIQQKKEVALQDKTSIEYLEKQINDGRLALEETNLDIVVHEKAFVWENFDRSNEEAFKQKKEELLVLDKIMSEKQALLEAGRTEMNQKTADLNKYQNGISGIKGQKEMAERNFLQSKEQLKHFKWEDYHEKSVQIIEEQWQQLAVKNRAIEEENRKLNETMLILKQKESGADALVKQLEQDISDLTKEKNDVQTKINQGLEQYQISFEELQKVLAEDIDVEAQRKVIADFRLEYELIKNEVLSLEGKLEGQVFDEGQYEENKKNFKELQKNKEIKNKQLIELKAETNRIKELLKQKVELLKGYEQLKKRQENLLTMRQLFTAAGFVNFVSSIYLKQLCAHANKRFRRMTRNQLSLQIGKGNNFEIVDYLNEGKVRRVKTLSGGQFFQVSLSLALALADSVQASSKTDKNFFFIDEGFGTQDNESVNVIFETLVHLHKEQKVVGIISHVDELKDKIPTYLNIKNDPEKGSVIYPSWE